MSDEQFYFDARDKVREATIFRRGLTKLSETKAQYTRGDYVVPFGCVDLHIVVASGAEQVIVLGYVVYEKRCAPITHIGYTFGGLALEPVSEI
jgi:hypothetical protein